MFSNQYRDVIKSLNKSNAVIEFKPNGTIITASENFCNTMGYSLSEIKGQKHAMFAEAGLAESSEYKDFWAKLNRGEFEAGEYKRIGNSGREVWI